MPNWTSNNLTLQHEDPAMIKRAAKALKRGKFLQEFIPTPGRNKEVYGVGDWYEFEYKEWGTKWDVGADGTTDVHPNGKMLHAYFHSASSPPIAAYKKLTKMGFVVGAMYFQEGFYAGIWEAGKSEDYNLSRMDSQQVTDRIPVELDETFGISESIAECEAEMDADEEADEYFR
jgi:hypothetical protein